MMEIEMVPGEVGEHGPIELAAHYSVQGQGMGGNFLGPQGLQGQDVVAGPTPVAERQLEKVGGDLLGDDRRLFQEFLVLLVEISGRFHYLVSIQKAIIICRRISLGRQFGADAGLIKSYENEFGG